jgi:hypothetical protein
VVAFADGSILTLGAGTRATVERFAYDPATGRGVLSIHAAAGAFEFSSGRMNKDGYDIRTAARGAEAAGPPASAPTS